MPRDAEARANVVALKKRAHDATENSALRDLIRHLARRAAEDDYKTFLNTGEIPYNDGSPERSRP